MSLDINQTRVSVGCRVTLEKKSELMAKAKENGFNSLSQYLETLILKGSNAENQNNEDEPVLTTLTELDFDIIEEKVQKALKSIKQPVEVLVNEDETEIDLFFKRFAEICGASEEEDIQEIKNVLLDEELDFEMLESILPIIPEEDIENDLKAKYLPFEFTKENKALLIEYLTYLVAHETAKDEQSALIGFIYKSFDRGGFFDSQLAGTDDFYDKFKKQNKLNILESQEVE